MELAEGGTPSAGSRRKEKSTASNTRTVCLRLKKKLGLNHFVLSQIYMKCTIQTSCFRCFRIACYLDHDPSTKTSFNGLAWHSMRTTRWPYLREAVVDARRIRWKSSQVLRMMAP